MKAKGINGPRGVYAKRREKHNKPDTGVVDGPNQLWCWDITHLRPPPNIDSTTCMLCWIPTPEKPFMVCKRKIRQ